MIFGPAERLSTLLAEALPGEDPELHLYFGKPVTPQAEINANLQHALALTALRVEKHELVVDRLMLFDPKTQGRRELVRSRLYTLTTADDVLRAAGRHLDVITKHGPGRVWFLDAPVHYVRDLDDVQARMVATCGLYVLRTMYGHEVQAVPR